MEDELRSYKRAGGHHIWISLLGTTHGYLFCVPRTGIANRYHLGVSVAGGISRGKEREGDTVERGAELRSGSFVLGASGAFGAGVHSLRNVVGNTCEHRAERGQGAGSAGAAAGAAGVQRQHRHPGSNSLMPWTQVFM